jgi:predicted methyltransferase MtxX (methanogen marker protein 4)
MSEFRKKTFKGARIEDFMIQIDRMMENAKEKQASFKETSETFYHYFLGIEDACKELLKLAVEHFGYLK